MSILYGFVNLDRKAASPDMLDNMGSTLAAYQSDACAAIVQNNVGMGFLNQYVTDESQYDELPCYDKKEGLYFVCDAIIDNRDELIELLGLRQVKALSDSRIVFEAYKKWEKECTRYLLGDFAFAVYDEKTGSVRMFRDHMGKRLVYYKIEDNTVFFSTLIKPLVDPQKKREKTILNERYLVEYLSLKEIRHEITPGITIYADINYVLPASCLTINGQSVLNDVYWDPLRVKTDHKAKKTDYIQEFRHIFTQAVRCRLRTTGDIGIFLSGGLDSSSVACVAASILREQDKCLNTYTAVPLTGFVSKAPRYIITNESSSVRLMQEMYPNMNTHFAECGDMNSLNVIERMLEAYEQPYKFIQNSYWLYSISQNASSDGCKIMLNGFQGNSTISYGSYKTILSEHLLRLRLFRFLSDFQAFCLHNTLSRKKFLVKILKEVIESVFCFDDVAFASESVIKEYICKYDVERKMRIFGYSKRPIYRIKDERRLFFHPTVNNQISSMSRKLSIANNICERDATCDKRVVEFCLSLPYDCYFDKDIGVDRGLIRKAMKGTVPFEILDSLYRGRQAADWLQRIDKQHKECIRSFMNELTEPKDIVKYLNIDHLLSLVQDEHDMAADEKAMWEVLVIYICNEFNNML